MKNRLVLLTVLMVLLTVINTAQALTTVEFQTVRGALYDFISNQSRAAGYGEGAYLITANDLKARIKLMEGEDAAQNPILIDVFKDDYIPGTALRFGPAWQATVDPANAALIRNKVIDHRRAGFSTDIVVYCLTGHSESPPVMALGAMSQAGFFDENPADPKPTVLALKWGRAGWGLSTGMSGTLPNPGYTTARGFTTESATPVNSDHANSASLDMACGGKTGAELVRCAGAWALSPSGGNVGSGMLPWSADQDSKYLPIDLKLPHGSNPCIGCPPPPPFYMMANGAGKGYAINIDIWGLFYTLSGSNVDEIKKLDPTGNRINIFTDYTQHTAALAAQGAAMLGYKTSFAKWGLPRWNNGNPPGWPEQYDRTSAGYSYIPDVTPVDTTPPVITAINATPGETKATITWTTNEPATSQVIYSLTSGGSYTVSYDTILHAAHSKTISGLKCNTTYYYKVRSYDGHANGGTSGEAGFTTSACTGTTPIEYSGDINGDGVVDMTDVLKALRFAVWLEPLTNAEIDRGDCAPIINGVKHPDGKIDLSDVVAIMRKAIGVVNF